jgi:Rrf2 family iron-sulfur cluster assembly transcriptional regulator
MKKSTMLLSTTAEHALRALSAIASLQNGDSVPGKELARRAEIPSNYLSKVLWVLGNAGIIQATRGSGGGYRLGRDADEIRLSEVVELFDRQKPERRCFFGGSRECSDTDHCGAHNDWRKLRESYWEFLKNTTIAQISVRYRAETRPAARRK